MRFIDLFSGMGGFRVAFEKNNLECVFSADNDKYACETYYSNFSEYPLLDIKDLNEKINKPQFIRQAKDFYSTRGTDESFKILFGALYGEKVDVIRPIDDVISPSNADYRKTRDFIVEPLVGDPEDLVNSTLYQDEFENISKAYAPVGSVEKISVGINTNSFYKLSLDASQATGGSTSLIYGNFSNHANHVQNLELISELKEC